MGTIFFQTITQPKGNVYAFPVSMIIFMFIVMLLVTWLMAGIISATKNTSISIKDGEVVINSFIYGRKIPIENIMVNEVKPINLNVDKEFNVSIRTNGIGMSNFLSGWAQLNNGSKALVFLTDRDNVLFVPTKDFILLFSMVNHNEFIQQIKNAMKI